MSSDRITISQLTPRLESQFNKHTNQVRTAFQRLSSGLRIEGAGDDAAGLSVSKLLEANSRVFTQGIRNLNDGISAVNIADSSLETLGNIARRVEELATQAANGTLSDEQRAVLQSEVDSLQSEWNRIVDSTSFNGKQLLTGLQTSTTLQGGYGTNGIVTYQVGDAALSTASDGRAGETNLHSASSTGVQGNGISGYPVISADGRYVVFQSDSSNLVSGDTNGVLDTFVRDTVLGTTVRTNTSSAGVEANDQAFLPTISANGRYVAFHSRASNLVASDSNAAQDIFIKDLQTNTLTRVSTSSSGVQANGDSYNASMSADGRYITFESHATNLVSGDTNGSSDIFVKDTTLGTITRVSVSSSGTESNGASVNPWISADGRYVTYESVGTNLVSGDSNGVRDIFMYDLELGTNIRVSSDSSGTQGNGASQYAAISSDGKFVVYESTSTNLVSGDSNGVSDIFLKELATGTTTRVSTDSSGAQGAQFSTRATLSADARYIGFVSSAGLVSDDTNGLQDIYVKDRILGTTSRISTNNSNVQGSSGLTDKPTLSADGLAIAYHSTFTNLVGNDTNGTTDIFVRNLSTAGIQKFAGMVVTDQASAQITMNLASKYSTAISQHRGSLAASMSRIETYSSHLESITDNYDVANSRIKDADIAEETTRLVTGKIRQKATQSIMAQANQNAKKVIGLLGLQ